MDGSTKNLIALFWALRLAEARHWLQGHF